MSYILDALKKSEQQRNSMKLSAETPSITPQPASGTARFGLPLTLLAVALAAGWFFIRFQQPVNHQLPPAEKPATALLTTHSAKTHPNNRSKGNNNDAPTNRTEPELPVANAHQLPAKSMPIQTVHQAPATPNRADTVPVFKPITPASPVSRSAGQLPVLPDEIIQPSPAETSIPSFSELPISVQQSIPPINIEGHIYDDNPLGRMVIINGVIRKEKQRIGQNLRLEEVTPNGVILSYQGHVFHMGVFER